MKEFDLAEIVLEDVLVGDTPFNEALRKIFQADKELRPLRPMVAGLVGCELRHHLLFSYLANPYEELDDKEKRTVFLALADLYFYKRIAKEEMLSILKEKIGEEKVGLLLPLLEKGEKEGSLLPEEILTRSNKHLSLRFNTPEWVLKILVHFGYGTTYKILKKNNKPFVTTVRVRSSVISQADFLSENPDFHPTSVEGILSYSGKISLRRNEFFKNGTIFKEKPLTKLLVDKFRIEEPNELFVYCTNLDSSLLKEVIENYGSSIGMNLGVRKLDDYPDVTWLLRQKQLKNVNFFGAEPDSLLASISHPQDLVIVCPNSSNFDLIREQPDYLLHFKREGMDELFAQEKAVLQEVSKYVAEGGNLLYMIYTISKKEGHDTIREFLANHPEFDFVEDRQFFPFEEGETVLYYALLRKKSKEAMIGTPLNNLLPDQTSASVQLNAMNEPQ